MCGDSNGHRLCPIIGNLSFQAAITDIYPHELQLKKTTECETELSYLDILVTIENGKYSTSLYDKRDSFDFAIVIFLPIFHLDLHMGYTFPS